MANYQKFIEAAIEKETQVLGPDTAVKIAKKVEDLKIDEEGVVKEIEGEEKEVLEDLVKEYQKIGGNVSASLIAREIENMIDEEIELPEILGKRIRADEFASAI